MISYNRLASEIYEILAAPSYDYTLKIYDQEGNSTATPTRAKWIYVEPDDIIIRLSVRGEAKNGVRNEEIFFWKNQDLDKDKMIKIIGRIRKVCNLFGVGLTVKDFARSEMQKKFSDMTAREIEEDQMDESIERLAKLSGIEENNEEGFQNWDDEKSEDYVPEEGEIVRISQAMIHGGRPAEVTGFHKNRQGEVEQVFVRFANGQTGNFHASDIEVDEDGMADKEYYEELENSDNEEYGREDYVHEDSTDSMFQDDQVKAILDKHQMQTIHDQDLESDTEVFQDLYAYFVHGGDMPYGIANGDDGDPAEWIFHRLDSMGLLTDDIEENDIGSHAWGPEFFEEEDGIMESMSGNSKRSYYSLEEARLVVVHEKMIDEEKRGARSRNIKEMYVEARGERFRIPENYLMGGKAMCRHLNEGGSAMDKTGKRIMERCREAGSLRSFIKEYRSNGPANLLEMAKSRVRSLREECGKMTGPKGYHAFKESFTKQKRIGKERINEMSLYIAADLGLNEDADLHEGIQYLAKMMVQENAIMIKNVAHVLSHLKGDRESGRKETGIEDLAKALVLKKVANSLSNEDKKQMAYMVGIGVRKLWKEHQGKISDQIDRIAMSINDDFLSTLFNRIVDKLVHDDKVAKHELAIANMIKDGVLGNIKEQTTMEQDSLLELETYITETAMKPFISEG